MPTYLTCQAGRVPEAIITHRDGSLVDGLVALAAAVHRLIRRRVHRLLGMVLLVGVVPWIHRRRWAVVVPVR